MDITDDLIIQWEPKIQRFLNTSFVLGMDREDLGQELRIAIIKAADGFDESRGTSFHTYLLILRTMTGIVIHDVGVNHICSNLGDSTDGKTRKNNWKKVTSF